MFHRHRVQIYRKQGKKSISFFLFLITETIDALLHPFWNHMVVPVIWLALIGAIYSRIAPFFALNCIFFPANEVATLKTKQPIRFQGLFKVTKLIAGKWKIEYHVAIFCNFSFQNSYFFPKKWMNLISNRLSTAPTIWTDQSCIWAISKWM